MITLDLNDKHLKENVAVIIAMREKGWRDAEIQKAYDAQVEKDKKEDTANE